MRKLSIILSLILLTSFALSHNAYAIKNTCRFIYNKNGMSWEQKTNKCVAKIDKYCKKKFGDHMIADQCQFIGGKKHLQIQKVVCKCVVKNAGPGQPSCHIADPECNG